ncbi:MAG: hypothetical protein M1419_09975 [Bacteroidetes bacterium]|nr:hypothetical protein [Bacteroidota bacterium]
MAQKKAMSKQAKNKKYSLKKLVEGINSRNIHKEIKTGKPVGKEVLYNSDYYD